ncbi:MAG TPA: hypothetical protein VNM14_25135 [Planctomycetota bacterium]|nr:hypothetical protein [Planctomycetota bacterium]
MSAAAAPATPTRFREPIVPKPAAPPKRRPGTDPTALAELRNAGATYDFLRRKGDPAQFWEMLRLARCRRTIIAPPEGDAPAPAPEVEASIVHELDSIRRQMGPLARDLRRYLENIPGLPEPSDRFEMALAFLLVSAREQQAVTRWLAEPGKHESKAAEKLRSLAAITDPYREALQPWTLQASTVAAASPETVEVTFSEIEVPPPPAPPPPPLDPNVELLGRALGCGEVLRSIHLDGELWEMVLVAATKPGTTRAVLEQLSKDLDGDFKEQARADGLAIEALYEAASDLRGMYGEWVRSFRAFVADRGLAPADPRAFDVGLGLMLCAPAAQDRLSAWLEEPATWQEEALGLLGPWMRRAQDYLATLK